MGMWLLIHAGIKLFRVSKRGHWSLTSWVGDELSIVECPFHLSTLRQERIWNTAILQHTFCRKNVFCLNVHWGGFPGGTIGNNLALAHEIVWPRKGEMPLSELTMTHFVDAHAYARRQWIKTRSSPLLIYNAAKLSYCTETTYPITTVFLRNNSVMTASRRCLESCSPVLDSHAIPSDSLRLNQGPYSCIH